MWKCGGSGRHSRIDSKASRHARTRENERHENEESTRGMESGKVRAQVQGSHRRRQKKILDAYVKATDHLRTYSSGCNTYIITSCSPTLKMLGNSASVCPCVLTFRPIAHLYFTILANEEQISHLLQPANHSWRPWEHCEPHNLTLPSQSLQQSCRIIISLPMPA